MMTFRATVYVKSQLLINLGFEILLIYYNAGMYVHT